MFEEFLEFMKEYSVIGLAIGFVIGASVKDLVSATVEGLIMPFIGIFLPAGSWESSTFSFLGAKFEVGAFLSAFIEFLIVAALVFGFVKYILKKKDLGKI